MLEQIMTRTNEYIKTMPKTERKRYGKFFTSVETARYMSSLYNINENDRSLTILDTGAGSGILSCELIEIKYYYGICK